MYNKLNKEIIMKFWSKDKIIGFVIVLLIGLGIGGWQFYTNNSPDNPDSKQNRASSKMTYGRFLDYLEMGWIKTVDFYNNGRIAIIEASSPELGDRSQKIRVEIPIGVSSLIIKLREAKINFTSHPTFNYDGIIYILKLIFFPVVVLAGLFFIFLRSRNFTNGPGQIFNLRNARAKVQLDAYTGVLFKDVAGIDEAKEELEEVVTFLKEPERFTAVGAKIPKGVLLIGPPGTGKTLLAKAIAGESGVPFLSISGSEFVEMFVGVGAARVRDLFRTAEKNSPCIIFIDEIDAVGRQRGAGVGGGNDEREQTLNQILTEMDGFKENTGVIVIAATNRADVLDVALLRPGRFDRQVNVNLPDIKGRVDILKVHARNKIFNSDIVLEAVAQRTPGFSGADLANILNEAAILTARKNLISTGILEINTAIDRVIAGLEGSALTDTKNKRLIAYHEIGHAIIGTVLKYHDDVEKVTLIARGQAKGLTWFTPTEDQVLITRGQIFAKIVGTLGGRAAEEVIFGTSEITTGASNDLQQVTSLARQMVTRFGMSKIGPFCLTSDETPVFLGRGIKNSNELSDSFTNKIDDQVKIIVAASYAEALKIIRKNRIIIDKLVDLLVQDEIIDGEKFRKNVATYIKLPIK
jgi:cell division protease FtsH